MAKHCSRPSDQTFSCVVAIVGFEHQKAKQAAAGLQRAQTAHLQQTTQTFVRSLSLSLCMSLHAALEHDSIKYDYMEMPRAEIKTEAHSPALLAATKHDESHAQVRTRAVPVALCLYVMSGQQIFQRSSSSFTCHVLSGPEHPRGDSSNTFSTCLCHTSCKTPAASAYKRIAFHCLSLLRLKLSPVSKPERLS